MDSKERFNNLVDELSTIDSITVKVSYFTNMSWATIDVNLYGRVEYDSSLRNYNSSAITLNLGDGYIRSINFSDGSYENPTPLNIARDDRIKAFMQVMNVVNKYFKESEYFAEKDVDE